MNIAAARVWLLRIPFQSAFNHSVLSRACSDSVAIKLVLDNGAVGFGEGLPRPYVTGETPEACFAHLLHGLLPRMAKQELPAVEDPAAASVFLQRLDRLIPATEAAGGVVPNAARAALELACADAVLRYAGRPLSDLVPPRVNRVKYSAVIASDGIAEAERSAERTVQAGIDHIKVKVGTGDDVGRVAAVRRVAGATASLRIDGNGGFDEQGAVALMERLLPYRIDCFEQPLPRGDLAALARLKARALVPIMVDESLVSLTDAHELIARNACDLFNIRVSKNGGVFPALQLARAAREAGLGFQIGCQAGETSILSAAGRHVAAHLADARFVEGSYGTLLLQADVSPDPVMFGPGGGAPLLTGPGLGVAVEEAVLMRYAEQTANVDMG